MKLLRKLFGRKKHEVRLCIHMVTRHRPYIDRLVQEELAKQRVEAGVTFPFKRHN